MSRVRIDGVWIDIDNLSEEEIKRFLKHFVFTISTALYMCNVVQYSDNYKSLRKRR